jgi:hypothetical protein
MQTRHVSDASQPCRHSFFKVGKILASNHQPDRLRMPWYPCDQDPRFKRDHQFDALRVGVTWK